MAWSSLKSSNLLGFDYDADQRILHVRFQSGQIYSYAHVESEVAEGLGTASSPGKYFNEHIKDQYAYV